MFLRFRGESSLIFLSQYGIKTTDLGFFRDIKINFLIDRKGRGSICVNLEKIIVIGQDSWGVVQCWSPDVNGNIAFRGL